MKVKDARFPLMATVPFKVIEETFVTITEENDLPVGLALVPVCAGAAANSRRLVQLINTSTAGQIIRVGVAPSFAGAGLGTVLYLGDSVTWIIGPMASGINAIANLAAGNLNRMVMDS